MTGSCFTGSGDCLYLASPKAGVVFYQPRGLKRLSPTWCMWLVIVNED